MLRLFNTLTGQQEEFQPLHPPRVGMYHCGPTVYDYPHIGNLRSYVLADILRRVLTRHGFQLDQVINITDVGHLTNDQDSGEDKIEAAARQKQTTAEEIADFYTQAFFQDLAALNIITDGVKFPRASQHITEQIELIKQLEEKGVTYQTSDGVYFDTAQFPDYGKLGQVPRADERSVSRVEPDPNKRQPADFALWKFSEPDSQRQQQWPAPWGIGYPGWHLECSAMSMKYLGETFDIHTGGIDHIPIHHNNEIAQSECATGRPLARFWLHNAFVDVKGEKMAKSAGNFFTLSDITDRNLSPLSYRWWLLTGHYRSPLSFDFDTLSGVERSLQRLSDQLAELPADGQPDPEFQSVINQHLDDDLDTPGVIARLWENMKADSSTPSIKRANAEYALSALGIELSGLTRSAVPLDELPSEVQELIDRRRQARDNGDFATADQLRDSIYHHGFNLQDGPDGPVVTAR